MTIADRHHVHGRSLRGPFPGQAEVLFGMGCFWGAERLFWAQPGVFTTAVGYAGGFTVDPSYREVCRSEEHTSELQSLMRISYAVFCLKKKNMITYIHFIIFVVTRPS